VIVCVGRVKDVSDVIDGVFRLTGIDLKQLEDTVEILMEEYAECLEDIHIREDIFNEKLSRDEMKIWRKYIGKVFG